MNFITDKKILITGGTGTFGKAFTRKLLDWGAKKVYIYSRDELKQWEMQSEFNNDERIAFLIGDIRDYWRLERAFFDIDFVVHAAAQKHVPSCEYNPFEAVKTNILGAENIINAAINTGVKKVIALSTDKAVSPVNLYGCTKAVMEKLFISGNAYAGGKQTLFSCVRYGNVIGSRGSIIPLFKKLSSENKPITITNVNMTRFWITVEKAINLVLLALQESKGGEVFVPKLPSMKVISLAEAIDQNAEIKLIGIRQGEKLHETLINMEESINTATFVNHFIIYPDFRWLENKKPSEYNIKQHQFEYNSFDNEYLTVKEMREMLRELKWI